MKEIITANLLDLIIGDRIGFPILFVYLMSNLINHIKLFTLLPGEL